MMDLPEAVFAVVRRYANPSAANLAGDGSPAGLFHDRRRDQGMAAGRISSGAQPRDLTLERDHPIRHSS